MKAPTGWPFPASYGPDGRIIKRPKVKHPTAKRASPRQPEGPPCLF